MTDDATQDEPLYAWLTRVNCALPCFKCQKVFMRTNLCLLGNYEKVDETLAKSTPFARTLITCCGPDTPQYFGVGAPIAIVRALNPK
jgi:hypothetical protein